MAKEDAVKKKLNPTIEELSTGVDPAVFAGVCAKMNWRPGKRVLKADFTKAVKGFLNAPISGRKIGVKK